jgi:hypothetical protein
MKSRRNIAVFVIISIVMLIASGVSVVQLKAQVPGPLSCGPCPNGVCEHCEVCNYLCDPYGCGFICQAVK